MIPRAALICGLLAFPGAALASTVAPGDVYFTLTQGIPLRAETVGITDGNDIDIGAGRAVDLNFGPLGDQFRYFSPGSTFSFNGIGPNPQPVEWFFEGLEFTDGSVLVGFEILSDLIESPITIITTSNSLFISYAPQDHRPGDMILGRYLTEPISPVPLPASAVLLLGALALLRSLNRPSSLPSRNVALTA
jgi:hypothetical protein